MPEEKVTGPVHFSQAFDVQREESELDFFDLNLEYDSRLFIDPFLIKRSQYEEERALFHRFARFFEFAYDKSLEFDTNPRALVELESLLNFSEPKEIGLGYTEDSHDGAGPGPSFASILLEFFMNNTARRLIRDTDLYPDGEFNPITLEIFTDGLGPDGISDITANLLMDYLVTYTQSQCALLNIPTKSLPLNHDGFDFEQMEWLGGSYQLLPENPLHPGQGIVLVPKRFLRALETNDDRIQSKVKGILEQDPNLKRRFANFLTKNVSDISLDEVRAVFLAEESVYRMYLEGLSRRRNSSYDFQSDLLHLLAIKTYGSIFNDLEVAEVRNCTELLQRVEELVQVYNEHLSRTDGWKDMWTFNGTVPSKPQREIVMGRIFRGMGLAYFKRLESVTFIAEAGTGAGLVDFLIVRGRCRVVVELKRLMNSTPKGTPPLVSYLHGLERQLPEYAERVRATHAIYVTGQHYTRRNRPQGNHDERVVEILSKVPEVEQRMREDIEGFESLQYVNIDMSPRPTASDR